MKVHFKPEGVVGECKKCGKCCQSIFLQVVNPFPWGSFDEDDWIRWLEFHNMKIYKKLDDIIIVEVLNKCSQLMPDLICDLHDNKNPSKKPLICRKGFGRNIKSCGFRKR